MSVNNVIYETRFCAVTSDTIVVAFSSNQPFILNKGDILTFPNSITHKPSEFWEIVGVSHSIEENTSGITDVIKIRIQKQIDQKIINDYLKIGL